MRNLSFGLFAALAAAMSPATMWAAPPLSGGSVPTLAGRRNAGVSVAQGKRNARKARNVARNRRHHR